MSLELDFRRVSDRSDPVRRSGEDQIARPQRASLGDEVDQLGAPEDQIRGAGAGGASRSPSRGRRSSGSGTSSAVVIQGPYGQNVSAPYAGPLGLAALQVAGGHVVGDAVAGDLAATSIAIVSSPS